MRETRREQPWARARETRFEGWSGGGGGDGIAALARAPLFLPSTTLSLSLACYIYIGTRARGWCRAQWCIGRLELSLCARAPRTATLPSFQPLYTLLRVCVRAYIQSGGDYTRDDDDDSSARARVCVCVRERARLCWVVLEGRFAARCCCCFLPSLSRACV